MRRGGFSAADREASWSELGEGVYDLLVIGGGITGAGIARDAAGRGLRVALVEAGDIAAGTSSRSSRLVHGGLRYLETLDFRLVFEALRERRRLLELAPHLVRPLTFLFPVYRGDPTGLARLTAGMWLYESLSLFRSPARHRVFGRAGALAAEPMLRAEGLAGGALYQDAQVDDARLTVAVARAAGEAGARIVTYAPVVRLAPSRGSAGAAELRDRLTDRGTSVQARLIVNATGPWCDRLRRLADPSVRPRLRMTKGAHLLFERERVANRNAVIFRSVVDGRVMFVLPWGDFTYVGTTDTEFAGDPADATVDAADIRYLLESANGIYPEARLAAGDVVSTWAGVRPLLAPAPSRGLSASATSREHAIWRDPSGLLNVAGGKLTTYRSMAAEVVDTAAEILLREFQVASGTYYTEFLPLPGAPDGGVAAQVQRLHPRAGRLGLQEGGLRYLVDRHGSDAERVLDLIEATPEMGAPLVENRPYLPAEAVHAVRSEMALTLEDVLRRRLHLFDELVDGGLAVAPRLAGVLAQLPELAWDAAEIDRQLRAYADAVRASRAGRGT